MEVIYKLTSPSGNVYIGRTKNFDIRMHQYSIRYNKKQENKVLYSAIKKYGWENFKKEIIAEVNAENAPRIEREYIEKYDSVKNGYNMTYATNGGDVWEGRRDTQEFLDYVELKKRQSTEKNAMRERYSHTKENRKKMSHPADKNPMYGKNHKKTTIQKMQTKAKGRFSLPWYQERYGISEGTMKYEERCQRLKNRKLTRDKNGKFICKSQK